MNKKIMPCLSHYSAYVLMILSCHLYAQPVAEDVLDSVTFSSNEYMGVIKITFRTPVRYISHYPKQHGKEIHIKVDLLNILNDNIKGNKRESLTFSGRENYNLEEIMYERDFISKQEKDHHLTLYFKKTVSFEIVQDANHRSLILLIHNPQ